MKSTCCKYQITKKKKKIQKISVSNFNLFKEAAPDDGDGKDRLVAMSSRVVFNLNICWKKGQ